MNRPAYVAVQQHLSSGPAHTVAAPLSYHGRMDLSLTDRLLSAVDSSLRTLVAALQAARPNPARQAEADRQAEGKESASGLM